MLITLLLLQINIEPSAAIDTERAGTSSSGNC